MSIPVTWDDLLELVVQSGLLAEERLKLYASSSWAAPPAADQTAAQMLAVRLIDDGLVTPFQARQLLAGKTKGYFFGDSNKYKALTPLGGSTLGPVVLAEDVQSQKLVAIRLLQRLPDTNPGTVSALERYVRETLAVVTTGHPNLVPVLGLEWSARAAMLIMENVEGTDLRQRVAESGPPPVPVAVQWVHQVASGLQHTHAKRVPHRELKPSRLVLGANGVVRVTGFGLNHLFRSPSAGAPDPTDTTLAGLIDFMSPEQAAGQAGDARSDVYGLGAVLYFLLTGRVPFEDERGEEKLTGHKLRQPPPVRGLRSEAPAGLVEVVGRMMAKNPNERPTMAAAVVALAPWTREPAAVPRPAVPARPTPPPSTTAREPLIPSLSATLLGPSVGWGALSHPAPSRPTGVPSKPVPPPSSAEFEPSHSSHNHTPLESSQPVSRTTPHPGSVRVPRPPEAFAPNDTASSQSGGPTAAPTAVAPPVATPVPTATAPPRRVSTLVVGIAIGVLALGGVTAALIATDALGPAQSEARPGPRPNPGPDQPRDPGTPPPQKQDSPPPVKSKAPTVPATGVQVSGSGSTFIKPAMEYWTRLYEQKMGVKIKYDGIGSGRGVENMLDKVLDFGCTDAPMTEAQLQKARATYGDVLHVPLALGAVVVTYNLDVKEQLRFRGDVLAEIYLGKITRWNHESIAASNPGVVLPDLPITVVRRSDSSGTTAIWTEFLGKVSPEWERKVGAGTTVKWPVGEDAEKSDGVAKAVSRKGGSIGYVELSFALERNLKYSQVKNRAERYVQPSLESVTAAAKASLQTIPPDLRYTLTDPPGEDSYPIAGTTWLVLFADQSGARDKGKELVKFIQWAVQDGQPHLKALRYAPLPPTLVLRVKEKIATIQVGE